MDNREEAIDILTRMSTNHFYGHREQEAFKLGAEALSAERRGRWIENEFGAYCSECGLYAYRSNGIPWKSNYCPMCGASMMDDNAIQHTKCVGNALDALDEVEE